MIPLSPEDARLEILLSQNSDAPLSDAGFSARVLDALPRQTDRAPRWGRIVAPTAGALAGLAVAFLQGGRWSDLMPVVAQLEQATLHLSTQLADTQFILVLAIAAGSLAIALFFDDPAETE